MTDRISKYKKSIMNTYLKLLEESECTLSVEKLFRFPDDKNSHDGQGGLINDDGGGIYRSRIESNGKAISR